MSDIKDKLIPVNLEQEKRSLEKRRKDSNE